MKINVTDTKKISDLLTSIQKRCTARVIDYSDILDVIDEIKDRSASMGMSVSNLKGAEFHFKNGTKVASSYSGIPQSTQFKLYRGSRDWFITEINRDNCNYVTILKFHNEHKFKAFYSF